MKQSTIIVSFMQVFLYKLHKNSQNEIPQETYNTVYLATIQFSTRGKFFPLKVVLCILEHPIDQFPSNQSGAIEVYLTFNALNSEEHCLYSKKE